MSWTFALVNVQAISYGEKHYIWSKCRSQHGFFFAVETIVPVDFATIMRFQIGFCCTYNANLIYLYSEVIEGSSTNGLYAGDASS